MPHGNTRVVCIAYDLNGPGQNYSGLIRAIKALSGTWWHHLDSMWLLKTTLTCVSIRDRLRPYLDANDELLVVELGPTAAWAGFNAKGSNWLKNNL